MLERYAFSAFALSINKRKLLLLFLLLCSWNLLGQPANQSPVASNTVANTITGTGRQVINMPLAYDAEGAVNSYTLVSVPSAGSLYLTGVFGNALTANTTLTAAQAATLYYQPPTTGILIPSLVTGTYTFSFRATDNQGAVSNTATYSIPVGTANTPVLPTPATILQPYIPNTAAQTAIIGLQATGGTIDGYRLTSVPPIAAGVLYTSTTATGTRTEITTPLDLTPAQAANLWFDPEPTFQGTAIFNFEASNSSSPNYSTAATYTIYVYSPPVATPLTAPTMANTAPITPIPDLTATDAVGTISNFKLVTLPASGTLYLNNSPITSNTPVYTASGGRLSGLSYKPAAGFSGNAVFTYLATDNDGYNSATVNYTIPITADNNQAVYSAPNFYSMYALTNGFVLAQARDNDGAIVSAVVTGAALPAFMTLQTNGAIVLTGTPVPATSPYSTTITTRDSNGGYSINVPVTITITSDPYQTNNAAVKTGENCYRLTTATNSQRGEIWRTTPVNLTQSFEISFNAYFGTKDADGADGIAFGLQRQAPNPLFAAGETGEGIGFGHGTSATNPRTGGISPSIAVEFDTFLNPTAGGASVEPDFDHIAIFQNGEERLPLTTPVAASSTSTNIEDGAYHPVRIIWDGLAKTLYVYFGGSLRTKYTGDIVATIFGNNPSVYFGFTSSTGGYNNEHSVCELLYQVYDADQDGIADDVDIDDDNDGIPDTVESGGLDPSADQDSDGIPNYRDADFPNGNYNSITRINRIFDKDGDGIINAFDIDADGDGISDVIEANEGKTNVAGYDPQTGRLGGTISPNGMPAVAQTNNNGVSIFKIGDKDQDGKRDFLDVDSDGDGILDNREAQGSNPVLVSVPADADKDGLDDKYDLTCGCTTSGVAITPLDTDVDGLPDYLDLDADSDGILDNHEAQSNNPILVTVPVDTDQDGLDDKYDATCGCAVNGITLVPVDTDLDGQPDFRDVDSDNDMMLDYVEAFDVNYNKYSLDDYHTMTTTFLSKATWPASSYYTVSPSPTTVAPDWLKLRFAARTPPFLTPGDPTYRDTDQDGLVDLMDTNNFGWSPTTYNTSYRTSQNITVLPVELLRFEAQTENATVRLTWTTASEQNLDYFEIQRSPDGKEFTTIGREKAQGQSANNQHYSFEDNFPLKPISYYRLKHVDFDGSSHHSKIIVTSITSNSMKTVRLFPNPAGEWINVDLTELADAEYHMILINSMGQEVKRINMTGGKVTPLNLYGIAKGKYILQIYREDYLQNVNLLKL